VKTDTAYQRLLDDLRNDGRLVNEDGGRAMGQCPAHDDTNPSLAITAVEGQVLVHCHAGCLTETVMKSLGRSLADLYDDRKGASYRYSDGRIVNRKAGKRFSQQGNTKGAALYRVERIGDATAVYVVEGEKDVHAVEAVGGTAVCSAMGAGKADKFDWTPLKDRAVIIVADKDEPGHKHARQVAGLLGGVAASVKVVEAKAGKDAADHIAAGHGLDDFVEVEQPQPEPAAVIDGAELLDDVRDWFATYIGCASEDHEILALWTLHTHVAEECYTSPRLLLDSSMPGSGKTTTLEHCDKLCCGATLMATISSAPMLARITQNGRVTLLIDEVDRALDPKKPLVGELVAMLNSGYKVGATRPVLVPVKGGGWEVDKMPTFAPVVLSGNSPRLPDDTRSRCIRILLVPDVDGTVADTDWEAIEDDAQELHDRIAAWAEQARPAVTAASPELPEGCRGRSREKWRPLARVAAVVGGDWTTVVEKLIERDLAEERADREHGLRNLPPAVVLINDLCHCWPKECQPVSLTTVPARFVPTQELVEKVKQHNPAMWGPLNSTGKPLTVQGFGRMLSQGFKIYSQRDGDKNSPRGYYRGQFADAWHRHGSGVSE